MATNEDGRRRCEDCRYWSDRCCHGLALRDCEHDHPPTCRYFTSENARLFTEMPEHASC